MVVVRVVIEAKELQEKKRKDFNLANVQCTYITLTWHNIPFTTSTVLTAPVV